MDLSRTFREDYGVYACSHVFRDERPVLLVVRDDDGSWQFLCNEPSCVEEGDIHLVGVGHLLERDGSLADAAEVQASQYYERRSVGEGWVVGDLET